VLDILQKVFYRSNPAREAFVELCEDTYVQKMTFDSYLYKVGARTYKGGKGGLMLRPICINHACSQLFQRLGNVLLVDLFRALHAL
jgi:hypothetical protein